MDSTTTSTTGKSYQCKIGSDILYPNKEPVFKQYGWVCPLCGRANAPWLGQCPCQPKKTWTFISPTAQTEWDPGKPYCTTTPINTKDDITLSDYRATDE